MTAESDRRVEHLRCTDCVYVPTVTRERGELKAACHCTHDDGTKDRVALDDDPDWPDAWEWVPEGTR